MQMRARQTPIGELGNQPTVPSLNEAVAVPCWQDTDPNKYSADEEKIGLPDMMEPDFEIPAETIDLVDLLSPSLCEVVSSFEGEHHREGLGEARRQRVSAYRARLQQGCAKFLPAAAWLRIDVKRYLFKKQYSAVPLERQLPDGQLSYTADESTGECKVQ